MYEQDYIMRIIKQFVRMVIKIVTGKDIENLTAELVKSSVIKANLEGLLDMIDDGKINDAENLLYDMLDEENMMNLEGALVFYTYINEQSDAFLSINGYSRTEIKDGLKKVVSMYGLDSIANIMFMEN